MDQADSSKQSQTELTEGQRQWILTEWRNRIESRWEIQTLALNWLFAANTGGLAGALTVVTAATEKQTCWLIVSAVSFGFGVVMLLGYVACLYAMSEKLEKGFLSDARQTLVGKMSLDDLTGKDSERVHTSKLAFFLAVSSGITAIIGIAGIAFGIFSVL